MNLYFIVVVAVICFFALLSTIVRINNAYQSRKMFESTMQILKDCEYDEDRINKMSKILEDQKKKRS